jgi:hypothetical protein
VCFCWLIFFFFCTKGTLQQVCDHVSCFVCLFESAACVSGVSHCFWRHYQQAVVSAQSWRCHFIFSFWLCQAREGGDWQTGYAFWHHRHYSDVQKGCFVCIVGKRGCNSSRIYYPGLRSFVDQQDSDSHEHQARVYSEHAAPLLCQHPCGQYSTTARSLPHCRRKHASCSHGSAFAANARRSLSSLVLSSGRGGHFNVDRNARVARIVGSAERSSQRGRGKRETKLRAALPVVQSQLCGGLFELSASNHHRSNVGFAARSVGSAAATLVGRRRRKSSHSRFATVIFSGKNNLFLCLFVCFVNVKCKLVRSCFARVARSRV